MALSVKAFLFSSWPPADVGRSAEIRRFSVDDGVTSSLTYLHHKLANVFQFKRADNLAVRWRDDDGDFIDVKTDEELVEALSTISDGLFKIYISKTGTAAAEPSGGAGNERPSDRRAGTEPQLHPRVLCDGCNGQVKGSRFKCLICYDYDLCGSCESQGVHDQHAMVRTRQPDSSPFGMFGGQGWFGPRRFDMPGGRGRCGRSRARPWDRRPSPSTGAGKGCCGSGGGAPRTSCCGGYPQGAPPCGGGPQPSQCGEDASTNWPFGGMSPDVIANLASDFIQHLGTPFQDQSQDSHATEQEEEQPSRASTRQCRQRPAPSKPTTSSPAATADDDEDQPMSESAATVDTTVRHTPGMQGPNKYTECMRQLVEFGFNDEGGWLQGLVQECHGDVSAVLDRIETLYKKHQA